MTRHSYQRSSATRTFQASYESPTRVGAKARNLNGACPVDGRIYYARTRSVFHACPAHSALYRLAPARSAIQMLPVRSAMVKTILLREAVRRRIPPLT